jgi:hypothetical protein
MGWHRKTLGLKADRTFLTRISALTLAIWLLLLLSLPTGGIKV